MLSSVNITVFYRHKTPFETVVAVLFGGLTAFLGYMLLSRAYFFDLWIFVLCFVIAKCQFSLLKVLIDYFFHLIIHITDEKFMINMSSAVRIN